MTTLPKVPLGKTDVMVTALGIGAWAWGDRLFWGYGRAYNEDDVLAAFEISREAGINFFDTAEMYGQGKSERILGELIRKEAEPTIVATKFMPLPWRLGKGSLVRAIRGSLRRLGLEQVDLYQIHFPMGLVPVETWAEALGDVVESGLTQAVGVSNYNEDQMRRTQAVLERRGLSLASNQVEYHLLNRKVEFNGLLEACHEMGVTLIAYSPLAQGILSGKYSPEKPPPGFRGRRYPQDMLVKTQPLIRKMREIGQAHGAKSPTQVAINWLIGKETLPIPGVKNARQAADVVGALDWTLTADEVTVLDEASRAIV